MISKKISQFIEVQELDTTAYIPLIQGSPLYNAVITPENLSNELSPFLDNLYIKVDGTNSDLEILKFNTTQPEQALLVGEMAYSQLEGTLEVGMNGGEVKQSLGLELYVRYKASENILNGQLLMYDGTDGNSGVIKLKKATVGCDPKLIYGIATEDAQNGGLHFATWYGKIKDINTSMYQSGNDLYQSTTTAGALQSTQPSAPHNKASYAKVINAHSSQGTLLVRISRSVSMNDVNDVQVTNATNGQALAYEDGVWKNNSSLGITDISPVGGSLNIAGTTVVEDLEADNVQSTGGFVKPLHDDTEVLLAGGGTKEISDFQLMSEKGQANGYASLGADGLVPTTQLPSFVDDVLEFANLAAFPATGETGKIYVAKDTNKTYRWSGSVYVYITSGAVDSVAGKTGVVTLNKSDVGLGNVDNTSDVNKPISTATQTALNGKVNNTGNETIAGVKTFSSLPKIPLTPIANEDAASKAYADGQANAALTLAQKYAENPEDVEVVTGEFSAKHYSLKAAASAAGIADSAEMLIKHEAEIASLENTINSANINQETTATATGVDTVSLPKTAANTGMQVQLFGQSAQNLAVNGGFESSLPSWWSGLSLSTEQKRSGSKSGYKLLVSATSYGILDIVCNLNDKLYFAVSRYFKSVTSQGSQRIGASDYGTFNNINTFASFNDGTTNVWSDFSVIATGRSGGVRLMAGFFGSSTAEFFVDDIKVINLTATFGAGNEPNKEQCDLLFANYFEGSDNVLGTGRVRSVGKNLFENKWELNKYDDSTGEKTVLAGWIRSINKIIIQPSTAYWFKILSLPSILNARRIYFYDRQLNFISSVVIATDSSGFIAPANAYYMAVSVRFNPPESRNLNVSLIIEKSSVEVIYEPYKPSYFYLTTPELRSNGLIKDEIRKGTNGYELVKRVGVGTLGGELIPQPVNFMTGWVRDNTSLVTIDSSTQFTTTGTAGLIRNGGLPGGNKFVRVRIKGSISTGTLRVRGSLSNSNSVALTGTFDTIFYVNWDTQTGFYLLALNAATVIIQELSIKEVVPVEAILNPSTLTEIGGLPYYTLATPLITPISHAGLLNSNSNGTAYFEPVIADAGVYGSNLSVQLTDYPIASFESIRKYANGTYTELSLTTGLTIAPGGLSFEHDDLEPGDLVMFTYAYSKESIGRSMTLTHYDSRFVEADTTNGKVYRIVPVVTNGVVSWTAVEV